MNARPVGGLVAAAAIPGLVGLLIGFFVETRGESGPFGNLGLVLYGGLILLTALVLAAIAAGLLVLRRPGDAKSGLAYAAGWLLSGFGAGVVLGQQDTGYCARPILVFADVVLGLPLAPLVLPVAVGAMAISWLALAASRRTNMATTGRAVGTGALIAGAILLVMAVLLTFGARSGGFGGNIVCGLTTGVAVGAAFGMAFLIIGLVLVPVAALVRRLEDLGWVRAWLWVPVVVVLLFIGLQVVAGEVAKAQQPVERRGTVTFELSGETFGQVRGAGQASCLLSPEGWLQLEADSLFADDGRRAHVRVDLTDRLAVSYVDISVANVFKMWNVDRPDLGTPVSSLREVGSLTTEGLPQLDPEPGDEAEQWRAAVSWDCSASSP